MLPPIKQPPVSEVINDKRIFSLEEVGLSIKRTLADRYKSSFWVKAEMNKLNHYVSFGHCYPDLVERKDGKIIAEMKAILWKTDYVRIQDKFLQVLKEPLKDGIQILFCAKIVYEPQHGIRLRILDIDPSYSLGELELEKQTTIDRLKAEGLFNKNKLLKFPFLPKRIAVISVQSSKGYSDFLQKIEPNPWRYRLFHMLFPSLLQGDRAVTEIIDQLNRIRRVIHHFDAVAIIRGGGGNIGLSCYNQYALCKEVATFPIPVLTGIGHATNETVAELVSYKNCITPTDLADFVLQKFQDFALPLRELENKLTVRSRLLLKENMTSLENTGKYFQSVTKNSILEAKNCIINISNTVPLHVRHILHVLRPELFFLEERMCSSVKRILLNNDKEIKSIEQRIELGDPMNLLKRGYTITLVNNKLIKSAKDVNDGDTLVTITADGKVTSIATSKN